MYYQRIAILMAGAVVVAPFSSLVAAESDIKVTPYSEVGYVHYSLEFKGDVPLPNGTFVSGDNKFITDMPSIKVGSAVSYGDFSGNIYYRATGKGDDIQDFPKLPGVPSVKWEGDRNDLGVSIGYSITESIQIFGGYRDAETKASGSYDSEYKFTTDGFFVGGSYQLGLTDTGALTFSLGYTWQDLKMDENLIDFQLPQVTGDGGGVKAGISWRSLINMNWGYSISADYYDYDFDLDKLGGVKQENKSKMYETETTFNVGLFYIF